MILNNSSLPVNDITWQRGEGLSQNNTSRSVVDTSITGGGWGHGPAGGEWAVVQLHPQERELLPVHLPLQGGGGGPGRGAGGHGPGQCQVPASLQSRLSGLDHG